MAGGNDVFISYARATSADAAQALREALQGQGVNAYLETEEIPAGDRFPAHLAAALLEARIIVILADATYFSRPWCVYEFLVAIAPYRQEPTEERVLDHVVVALAAEADPVLPHLPPPMAQASWPALGDTGATTELVLERLAAAEESLEQRLEGHDDQVVRALAEGGMVPRAGSLSPADGGKGAGGRYLEALPVSLGERLFGRQSELWELFHILETRRAGGAPASCLVDGVDGMGKTRLVAEYVWRYGERYTGGIVWIDASDEDVKRQLDAVQKAFGAADGDGLADAIAGAGPMLWVVDQIPEPRPGERPAAISRWCPPHRLVSLLATSQRTGIIDIDETLRLSQLDIDDAVNLLKRSPVNAGALDDFGWTDLAHWVGCMPLALEILHQSLAEGLAQPEQMLARSGLDEPSEQLDEEMTVLAEDIPAGALRGIHETFRLSYEYLSSRPATLRAAHKLAWLRAARLQLPWVDTLIDARDRTLLAKRSWLDYRPGRNAERASWRMHRIVGSFLRSCSPDPDGELVELFEWLAQASRSVRKGETHFLDRHASTLYERVFSLANRAGANELACIPAGANAAAELAVLRLEDFDRRGIRYLSAQFLRGVGAAPILVERLRARYELDGEESSKSIASMLSALSGVREAGLLCVELLGDSRDSVRWQAYLSASALKLPELLGVPYVDRLVREENENVRNNMVAGIENMFRPDGGGLGKVMACVTGHLASVDAVVRQTSSAIAERLLSLPNVPDAAFAAMVQALREVALNDDEAGEAAARTLAGVRDTATYGLLTERLAAAEDDCGPLVDRLCAFLAASARLPAPNIQLVDQDEGMEFRGHFFPAAEKVDPALYEPVLAVLRRAQGNSLIQRTLAAMTSAAARLALVDEAHRRLEQGEHESVLLFADQVAAAQPDLSSVHWWRGQAYEALGRYADAVAAFSRTLENTPAFVDAALHRGYAYLQLGQYDQALIDIDATLESEAGWSYAWYLRSSLLSRLNRVEEALASIDRALAIEPDDAEFHFQRAWLCRQLERFSDARAAIVKAIALVPQERRYQEFARELEGKTQEGLRSGGRRES